MNLDGLYYKVTQTYLRCKSEERELRRQRDRIDAELALLEDFMTDLNDMLCRHGNHVYEHFEESEEQS